MIIPIYILPHSMAFAIMYCVCALIFSGAIFRDLWIERKQHRFMETANKALMRHLTNGQWK